MHPARSLPASRRAGRLQGARSGDHEREPVNNSRRPFFFPRVNRVATTLQVVPAYHGLVDRTPLTKRENVLSSATVMMACSGCFEVACCTAASTSSFSAGRYCLAAPRPIAVYEYINNTPNQTDFNSGLWVVK